MQWLRKTIDNTLPTIPEGDFVFMFQNKWIEKINYAKSLTS